MTKTTYNLRRVMKTAWRMYRYDPTCMGDMRAAMRKAWDRTRRSVQADEAGDFTVDL